MEEREKNEIAMQSKAYQYIFNKYPKLRGRIFAINNNSENKIKGAFNKAMGVFSGVSDMCLILPNGRTAWIEWKTETGRQSTSQIDWQNKIESLGHKYYLVRSEQQFVDLIHLLITK